MTSAHTADAIEVIDPATTEFCDRCNNPLDTSQIGLCDECQSNDGQSDAVPYETVLKNGMASIKDQQAIEECGRTLISAYARDPEHVDWNDVQQALSWALQAFGLPEDFPQKVHALMVRQQAEEDQDEE